MTNINDVENKGQVDIAARAAVAQLAAAGHDVKRIGCAVHDAVSEALGLASSRERWIKYANTCKASTLKGEGANGAWRNLDEYMLRHIIEATDLDTCDMALSDEAVSDGQVWETVASAALRLGVSESTVRARAKSGAIRARRAGNRWQIAVA